MSNLINERDKRTKRRKKMKDAFDKAITLSAIPEKDNVYRFSVSDNDGTVRLLDEGAIVTASGDLDIYIMKGAVEKYVSGSNEHLDNLTDDYVGTINIGHLDFATFPVGIVGEWTRNDFTITDNGEGRHGLDVDLHLNDEHPLIQALKVQGIDVGVSVEMYLHFDEEASKEEGAWMVDEIFISDFAIVGECGNVGSSETISLKGGESMKKADINLEVEEKELDEEIEEKAEEVKEEVTESTEETKEEESVEEDTDDEEEVDETDDEEVEDEESDEESDDEEVEDEEVEESVDKLSIVEKLMAKVEALESSVDELKKENAELKKSNRKKEKKLKALKEADKEFTERFKGLSVSLGLTKEEDEPKEEVTDVRYASGDGIGE